jgi:hypothetical protein
VSTSVHTPSLFVNIDFRAGTCQPISDIYSRINVVSRAVCFALASVGKITVDGTPSLASSGEIGLMAMDVGGMWATGRAHTKRSGFA